MSRTLRIVTACLIFFSVFTVYITIPKEEEFAHNGDEGYYYAYANIIKEKGISQFPLLLEQHFQNKALQLYPHPARVGHILMTALWFKVFPSTYVSLAHFSLLTFILFLGVSFYYCRKFFGRDLAYLYTLLLSCNPLLMTAGRRVLQDSNLNLFWGLSVWLFLDFLINRKKGAFILFLLAFSTSIMIKEASVILLVFFLLAYLLYKHAYRQELSDKYLLAAFLVPLFLVGSIYVSLFGFSNVVTLAKFILGVHFPKQLANSYSLFCMGPWYKYIMDFLMITPFTTLLSIGYFFHILFSRRFEWKTVYFMAYLGVVFAMFSSMEYSKIVRFVASLDIGVSLFAVLALYELFRLKSETKQAICVFLCVIAIFFINYNNFIYLFLFWNIYDPLTCTLLQAKQIIPVIFQS